MSIESDDQLIRETADKLIANAGKLTGHDLDVAVAALGLAMMVLARTYDSPREQINKLLDIIEKEINNAAQSDQRRDRNAGSTH